MYQVKSPAKFRRGIVKQKEKRNKIDITPRWFFETEQEAIAFAKTFEICYVDVWFQGQVIFRNYSIEKPVWMSEGEATVVREQNVNAKADRDKRERSA